MLGRHYHIASISPQQVVYYESEYSSLDLSVDDFIRLVTDIYTGHIDNENPLVHRETLINAANNEDSVSVVIGLAESQFRIFWSSCDGECGNIAIRN